MTLDAGTCELLDTPTDIIVLQCNGRVTTSGGRDVGSWHDDGTTGIDVELSDETVSCSPG
jgi:hypothetical protein